MKFSLAPPPVSFPAPNHQYAELPMLPSYPNVPQDLLAIERAQLAVVMGPFKRAAVNARAAGLGDMAHARVSVAKEFLAEKMMMPRDKVASAGIVQACWTDNDND